MMFWGWLRPIAQETGTPVESRLCRVSLTEPETLLPLGTGRWKDLTVPAEDKRESITVRDLNNNG